jgi:hypothetical protein
MRAALAAFLITISLHTQGAEKNGFNLTDALIPEDEIHSGGPPRDGIPSINKPRFVNPADAHFLKTDDRVLGITRNGVSKAYPVAILNWHEIVNDNFAGEPVVVSFCPLCGTGMAYLAAADDQVLDFGVSGLLYNSDMLLYDRQTQSLWSQLRRQAVTGPLKGVKLQAIPVEHTQWVDWKQRHPKTQVLSIETGYQRDYSRNPYAGYGVSSQLYFPVTQQDRRYHPKEPVLGIELAGHFKAYPFEELKKSAVTVHDTLAGQPIVVKYNQAYNTATAVDAQGSLLPAVTAYWFAWYAFHPDTGVYVAE